jgi:hypothetical protein
MRTTKQLHVASLIFMGIIFVSCHEEIEKAEPRPETNTINYSKTKDNANARVPNSVYWNRANQTHDFVVGNLLTPFNSYRANTTTHVNNAWEWYQISQILADAEMIRQGDLRYASYMNNTYSWMGNMWHNASPIGGYFASANLDGSGAAGDKYIDDNALTGVIYLECYNVTTGTQQTNYLNSAKATANWLMNSNMWDNTFGGGFWWNTTKPVKPTQSNGLAMQLFIRLYRITGQSYYLNWANSVRTWLEANMYDTTDGLFIWQIEANGTKRMDKFTYDNAIMIEAYLDFYNSTGDNNYRIKAINLAIKLNTKLWDYGKNVYKFNTNDPRVNPAWCGWASQSMIKLYKNDPNPAWLDYAKKNIDFLNTYNRNASNGGYCAFTNLNGTISDNRYEGVDQAWMQRINAQMAEYQ